MKNFLLISLGCSAYAFQHGVHMTKPRVSSALMFYPDSYIRAVECATHSDYCDIDELEQLAQELDQFQASEAGSQLQQISEHYVDTLQISLRIHDMLEMQSNVHGHRRIHPHSDYCDNDELELRISLRIHDILEMQSNVHGHGRIPHSDCCDIDELEQLAQELDQFQASEAGSQLQQISEHYVDTLRISLRIHDMLEKQSGIHDHRKIPSFVEMLEQTLRYSQVQGHHSKAIPSFLNMLEVVTATDGSQQVPKENTNPPPLFLDMLTTITGNNRYQKPYIHAIRPFVDMLKEVIANDDIIQPQQKREIPSFLEMLNQVV